MTSNAVTMRREKSRGKKQAATSNSTIYRLVGTASVAVLMALWWLVTATGWIQPLYLPSPASILSTGVDLTVDGYRGASIWVHLAISMQRVLLGFAIAVIIAVPLGILVGSSRIMKAVFEPGINFFRPLPPLAYYSLLIVWFGIGETSKVALLALASFPIMFVSTIGGVGSVQDGRIAAALSLGADKWQVLRYVTLPSSLPSIFTGMRVTIAATYTCVVAAELIAANAGIGWMIFNSGRFLQTDVMFVGIIVIGITGMILDYIVHFAQRKFVPWLGKA